MTLDLAQYLLGALSGLLVGYTLGLVGGGGSILAVPLMVYLVGVSNPHIAIGTSALAVAANAATGLLHHARAHTVKWRFGVLYAAAGVVGAVGGSSLGKAVNGQKLLFLFALLMIGIGALMLRHRNHEGLEEAQGGWKNAPKVLGFGFGTGILSGFFGIGGGFLIVPGLIAATRMPMLNAVGTSLVAVTAFGLTTASNYALSGLVDWGLAFDFILGGLLGGMLGAASAQRLAANRGRLTMVFSGLIFAVALYMLWRSGAAILHHA